MNTRIEEAKEWISGIKDKIMEINEAGKKSIIMEHENGLREISDSIKFNNICIIGFPVEEEKEKGKIIYLRK